MTRGFVAEINPTHDVWAPTTQLPDDRLPPLHTLLFKAFLVLDCHVRVSTGPIAIAKGRSSPSTSTPDDDDDSASYVDFGFGNTAPGSTLCGFNRFSVTRNNLNSESATSIHIAYPSMACSPSTRASHSGSIRATRGCCSGKAFRALWVGLNEGRLRKET
jgi:hypothetical protein